MKGYMQPAGPLSSTRRDHDSMNGDFLKVRAGGICEVVDYASAEEEFVRDGV